jgi:hypothetical protein
LEEETEMDAKSPANHGARGAAALKAIVWILIVLGAYSGYKFAGFHFAKGRVERVVEKALDQVRHDTPDDGVRHRIIRQASASSISLELGDIQVGRESHPGERVIHVDVAYPIKVSYLGSDRTVKTGVHVSRSIQVDEAALARKEAARRRENEVNDAKRAAAGEHVGRLKDALSECEEKHGKGNCRVIETGGGKPGEIQKWY